MNDKIPRRAEERHGWWPGWIWSIPIAAVGLVIWLAVRSWTETGPQIQVVFPEIANLKPGDTKVQFEGMDVGEVENSRLEPDLRHIRVTLSLHPDLRGHLGADTRFWIIGKQVSLAHISDLKSIITGASIGISPSPGHSQDTYQGLANAPVLGFGATGTSFKLHASSLGSIQQATPIYYLGEKVGQVEAYSMTNGRGFDVTAFINTPYDQLVHDGSRFWRAGPLHLSTGADGPSLQFQSLPALVEGAIAFATPAGVSPGAVAGHGHDFTLYDSEDAAENVPDPNSVAYRLVFHNVSGVPDNGASVKLMGKRVGSVTAATLQYDPDQGRMNVLATIVLEPNRIALPHGAAWSNPRPQMDDMLRHLIADGLHAELAASPPVIGGQQVTLALSGGQPGSLGQGPEPEIPTVDAGGGVAGIMASANDVMTKVNQMPLPRIADNLRDISHHLAQLTSSPALAGILSHVDRSTANLQRISSEMRQQLPPTLADLRRTVAQAQASLASARDLLSSQGTAGSEPGTKGLPETLYEISLTARSLRSLVDLLDQHPSALLTGSR
ncbi:intermembrane transport protein PqiB [Rhodopila sp.]|uniref:PqiB family protein n=1 Tax=Rhodopila sp. TaxID=2480087 RepID=UPI003D0D7748